MLCLTNSCLNLYAEGIQQAKEALEIHKRINYTVEHAQCLKNYANLLRNANQLDAAEEVTLQSISLLSGETSDPFTVCESYRTLGDICSSKGETEKAISHYEAALGIASSFNWPMALFWNHFALAELFSIIGRFEDAHTHITYAKSYVVNDPYCLGRAMQIQAHTFYLQGRLEEAKFEALDALDMYNKLGASYDAGFCQDLLWQIEGTIDGKLLETMPFLMLIHYPFLAQGAEGSK